MKRALLLLFFFSIPAYAIVDMRNANYSDTWTDIILPGSGYDLRVRRSYNSRNLYNGLFGFGWCSDFETKLNVTPENRIVVTECGGGMQINYMPQNPSPVNAQRSTDLIINAVKKENPAITPARLATLRKQLMIDSYARDEFFRRLNLQGQAERGRSFYADGRQNESIVLKDEGYVRTLADGTYQMFDTKGLLQKLSDRNGNFLKMEYKGDRLSGVIDNNGRKLTFAYHQGTNRVATISGPNKVTSSYIYKGEDLTEVLNQWGNVYKHKYDDLHNITRIEFPDGTYSSFTYNQDRDWVTAFRDRDNCTESYKYEEDKKDPLNRYWSQLTKTCDSKVVFTSRYDFFHKINSNSTRYLSRVIANRNGDKTDTVYHPDFGRPISVDRNGIRVTYKFYEAGNDRGLLHIKDEPGRQTEFFFENECKKVSQVVVRFGTGYRDVASKGKKSKASASAPTKTMRTEFGYEPKKCNLKTAKNSDGMQIKLDYDRQGRIATITDQAKKIVNIKYDEDSGKPAFVTRPGLGTINVRYKRDGTIDKVDSKDGPTVAVQVASVFNNLLEVIAPATTDLTL